MKHTCPKCGHEWEAPSANQRAGGKARWKRTTKKQRSAAAKAAALARWKTKKATGPQNEKAQTRAD
jgi:hypothetical protein